MEILIYKLCGLVVALSLLAPVPRAFAQQTPNVQIKSFSVGPDQTTSYPSSHIPGLPDEHTSFMPPESPAGPYLLFGASKLSGAGTTGGAVVLETSDFVNFALPASLGYSPQVMTPPTAIDKCNPAYVTEFDGNYAAPGSVVQDPTLPPGNFIMIYEAENHCPGGVVNFNYYATVGFARSSDSGKTWPAPINGVLGGPARHPVLQSSDPQPSIPHGPEGDAIPSAFVDLDADHNYYLYVVYEYHPATGNGDGLTRVARATLGVDPLNFQKWYNGSFSQPGIGGSDTGVTPSAGCANGFQSKPEISYNDGLGLYLLIFVCTSGPSGSRTGAWYYSTATSLDLQNWTTPQIIQNSQFPDTVPCPGSANGGQFDGWYPSTVSPGAGAGHTKLTGYFFFLNGCDTGARQFTSRTFTITTTSTCNYALNLGGQGFLAQGGSGAVNITTSPGCPWTVDFIPAGIMLTSPASGTGSGTVTFTVIANSGGDLFNSFVIAGQTFTIEQEAASIPGLNFLGSMPHLAAEENWMTAFTLVNKSGVSTTARLSLFGDDNSYSLDPNGSGPLTLPLAFPQQISSSGPLLAASFDQTLAANASLIVDSAGAQSPPVLIGSAQLAATGAVDGFAIFHQIVTTQEAVVPLATRNARSYLLPFDDTNNLVLGVDLANISAQAVAVQVVIRDDTGALIPIPFGQQSLQVAAGDHYQFGLAAQFPATANMRGTIEFDTPQNGQISVLGLRFTPPNNALTTIPALASVGTGGGSFAHLASGGDGWQTTFVLVNTGTSAAQFTLSFFADMTGALQQLPLSFPQPGGGTNTMTASVTQMLPAGATRLIVSSGAPQLITGSAQLITTGNVSGFVIFRHNGQEAVVPLESRNASAYIIAFDNTNGTATGIAVNAVSTQQVNVPLVVRDTTGATIATDTITLNANGHTQFTLVTDKYPMTASIQGTIEFDTPAGAHIGALGIRIPNVPAHTYTTLPALAK